jgi:hypothetical protein
MKAALLTTWRRMPLLTPLQQVSTHRPLYPHVGILEASKATANTCCTALAHQAQQILLKVNRRGPRAAACVVPVRLESQPALGRPICNASCRQLDPTGQPTRQLNRQRLPAYGYALFAQLAARPTMPLRSWPTKCSGTIVRNFDSAGDGAPVAWGVVHPRHESHAALGRHAHKSCTASTALFCLTALVVRRRGHATATA